MRYWLIHLLILLLVANPVLASTISCGHQSNPIPTSMSAQHQQHCTHHQSPVKPTSALPANDCTCAHCHCAPVIPSLVAPEEACTASTVMVRQLPLLPLPEHADVPYRPPIIA